MGKGEIARYKQISPFPTVFSKGLFPRGVKGCPCVGMGQGHQNMGLFGKGLGFPEFRATVGTKMPFKRQQIFFFFTKHNPSLDGAIFI